MERLTDEQFTHFKDTLLAEKERLTRELKTVGKQDPDSPGDWVPVPDKMDIMRADKNEVADKHGDFEDNASILDDLEFRYNQVLRALEKIELGTYGTCEVGGEQINLDRLEANPAATTCIEHASALHK